MAGLGASIQTLIEVIQETSRQQLAEQAKTTEALRELTSKIIEGNQLIKVQSEYADWHAHCATGTRQNVEWRQCNEIPSLQEALRMLDLQASGQKWSNREAVFREVARNLRDHKISCTGQLPVGADVQRGQYVAVRELLRSRGIIPKPDQQDYDAQWETGRTACYMPAIQKQMIQTGEITQAQIDEALNYQKFPWLRWEIEWAIEESLPINQVTGHRYHPDDWVDDVAWQLSENARLRTAQGGAVTEPASSFLRAYWA